MKEKKYCQNCRWYNEKKSWCRMMAEEHKENERGCWWHDFKDKALRRKMCAERIFEEDWP